MKLLREEYKKLSKFVVLFVIPWLILFNLLLCWLDMTFPRFPLPLFLLLYALIIAALFSLGYVCGKRRCPVLALAVGCLQYLLYNLLSIAIVFAALCSHNRCLIFSGICLRQKALPCSGSGCGLSAISPLQSAFLPAHFLRVGTFLAME